MLLKNWACLGQETTRLTTNTGCGGRDSVTIEACNIFGMCSSMAKC